MPGNLFWTCQEKRESTKSCDNWNDCTKTASKDVGWTFKVGRVTEALKVMRDRDVWKVMIGNAKEHGT